MTERSRFRQQFALDAAPAALDVVMLRQPEPAEGLRSWPRHCGADIWPALRWIPSSGNR